MVATGDSRGTNCKLDRLLPWLNLQLVSFRSRLRVVEVGVQYLGSLASCVELELHMEVAVASSATVTGLLVVRSPTFLAAVLEEPGIPTSKMRGSVAGQVELDTSP